MKAEKLGTVWTAGARFQIIDDTGHWETIGSCPDTPRHIAEKYTEIKKQYPNADIWLKSLNGRTLLNSIYDIAY